MEKIIISLTRAEWVQLTAWILAESTNASSIEDKYMKALLYPLLKQVYVKLHNKLHSLKEKNNKLYLTYPEASVTGSTLMVIDEYHYLQVDIIGFIDQKLT